MDKIVVHNSIQSVHIPPLSRPLYHYCRIGLLKWVVFFCVSMSYLEPIQKSLRLGCCFLHAQNSSAISEVCYFM